MTTNPGNEGESKAAFSEADESPLQVDKWYAIGQELRLCIKGFYSYGKADSESGRGGESLCRVTADDSNMDPGGKPEMKVIAEVPWTKSDSVALAVFTAKSLANFIHWRFSKAKVSKWAIEAAIDWLKDPSGKNSTAASAAADSAYASAKSCGVPERYAAESAALCARCAASGSGKAAVHFAICGVETAVKSAAWKGGPSAKQKALRRIGKMLRKKYFK
ncbi:MAG: hypothetical protein C4530_17045 [Desulfobacteraceae bacterium]|nr:MAG: hypothetical protein C4530_17045 [Desulfobacteraceae bacterium]